MFSLYEGNRETRVMVRVGEGNHNTLGRLMDTLRHRPMDKKGSKPFYALYSDGRLVSSTY